MQDLVVGHEYRIFHGGYAFPSWGVLADVRWRANGDKEYVFRSTRHVGVIQTFALVEADVTHIQEV